MDVNKMFEEFDRQDALAVSEQKARDLGELVVEITKDPNKYLSPAEVKKYEDAQQSIVDARDSAPNNGGRIKIL